MFKTFVKPSKIIFKEAEPAPKQATIADTRTGDTFLHQDTVFMRTEVSPFQAIKRLANDNHRSIRESFDNVTWVINLQTGRTYILPADAEIEHIQVTMSVATK